MKKLCILLALAFLTVNAYAVISPDASGQKFAEDDNNFGREHIDIIVRHLPEGGGGLYESAYGTTFTDAASASLVVASEGAIVIWATESRAIIGRDITMTMVASSSLVAGIISEPGGIASNSFGRMRIYGYFDDVIAADETEPTYQGNSMRTSALLGQVGGGKADVKSAGVSLEDGSGSDLAEIQGMVNVRQ